MVVYALRHAYSHESQALETSWRNWLMLRWLQLQYSYVMQLKECCSMMERISMLFGLPHGASPRAMLVNEITGRRVRSCISSFASLCSRHVLVKADWSAMQTD